MGRKKIFFGGGDPAPPPFWGGGAGSPSNTTSPGPGPSSIPCDIDPCSYLATTDMGRKLGAVRLWGGAGSPSKAMWPGPRHTCVPSFILIRPTVWPQYTNVTDMTDRQRNGPIAYGEPFYKRSPKNVSFHVGNCMFCNSHYST